GPPAGAPRRQTGVDAALLLSFPADRRLPVPVSRYRHRASRGTDALPPPASPETVLPGWRRSSLPATHKFAFAACGARWYAHRRGPAAAILPAPSRARSAVPLLRRG